MTHSPAFAAAWCRTIKEGIPAGFSAETKTDLPKLSTEADIARIVLISHLETGGPHSVSMDFGWPWNE
jgi:hypothetical protein